MLIYLAVHAGLGLVFTVFTGIVIYWFLAAIAIGILEILSSSNRNEEAIWWAAYISGMEIFLRMTGQNVFWESGKYAVIIFLALGLFVNNRQTRAVYWIYFLLLIPSIFFATYPDWPEARKMISFNLSGPLCLAVSGIYFYKRNIKGTQIIQAIRILTLPVVTMVMYIFIITPDFSTIEFGSESIFEVSGGYGPNQVSLVFGVCIFFIVALRYYGISLSGNKWIDYGIVAVFLFRGLITFSRGGILGAGVAIAILLLLNMMGRRVAKGMSAFLFGSILILMTWLIWNYTNTLTQKALEFRYKGVNIKTGKPEEYTSSRMLIIMRDWNTFLNNPVVGVGPGRSKLSQYSELKIPIAAHTEWSRMLAEHGMFGVAALLILILVPLAHQQSLPIPIRALLLGILVLSFFSMFHAAMRLAMISYLYGLALIIPGYEKNTLRRQ
jgi:hypothetical protein